MTSVIRRSCAIAFAALTLVWSNAEPSSTQEGFFEQGNQLYLDGEFGAALDHYLQIIDQGMGSAPLYYNLGNTYFKLGDVGRSILFYERALRLDPGNADTQSNLELARRLATDEITPLPTFWVVRVWRWWVRIVPLPWLTAVLSVVYVATIGGFTMSLVGKGSLVSIGRKVGWAAGALSVFLAANLAARLLSIGQPDEAIVITDEVLVQSAPSDDRSLQVFTIHTGTKVRVDQLSGEWAEIVLEDGKVGWVRRDVFEII